MRRSTSIRVAVFAALVAALLTLLAGIASRQGPNPGPVGINRLAVGSELDKPVPLPKQHACDTEVSRLVAPAVRAQSRALVIRVEVLVALREKGSRA